MARTWINLVLFCLAASQVDCCQRKVLVDGKLLPEKESHPWDTYLWAVPLALAFVLFCCCFWSWRQKISTASTIVENKPTQVAGCTSMKLERTISPSSTLERTGGLEEENLLPRQRVMVQLVDEQLVDLEVPPAELTLTSFNKLLSDLTFYSGVPDIQGLLVKSEPNGFVQVFDMERIPQGNLKVRAVISGNKKFLRLYQNAQLAE